MPERERATELVSLMRSLAWPPCSVSTQGERERDEAALITSPLLFCK